MAVVTTILRGPLDKNQLALTTLLAEIPVTAQSVDASLVFVVKETPTYILVIPASVAPVAKCTVPLTSQIPVVNVMEVTVLLMPEETDTPGVTGLAGLPEMISPTYPDNGTGRQVTRRVLYS